MFCAYCGAIRPDAASFCPTCGRSIGDDASPVVPAAALHAAAPTAVLEAPAAAFFNVGTTKLVLMSLSTFSLYEVYWLYKNWSVEAASGADVSPAARAFFAPLFIHSLALRINERATSLNLSASLRPALLTTAFVLLSIAVRLPDPFWLIGLLSGLVLIPIQNQMARINAARAIGIRKEARFTAFNIAWLIVSGLLWFLVIVGTFLPNAE
jgi:hypothetical protein